MVNKMNQPDSRAYKMILDVQGQFREGGFRNPNISKDTLLAEILSRCRHIGEVDAVMEFVNHPDRENLKEELAVRRERRG